MTDMTNAGAGMAPVPNGVLADAAAAAAAFLRLPDAAPDGIEGALLRRLAAVAIGMAEAYLGQVLIVRTVEDVVVADGGWHRLAAEPVRAIAGIIALPTGAAPVVLPVESYRIDIAAGGCGWVQVADRTGGVPLAAVAYTAGLAPDWAAIPAPVAQGLVTTVARLFVDRDGPNAPANDVAALWRPFRRLRLAEARR